jgi:hypothetical protein
VNKLGAEIFFEGGDLFADRGLTNSTFSRDSGKVPFFDYSDEHLHRIQFVHDSLPPTQPKCIPVWNGFYSPKCQICLQE